MRTVPEKQPATNATVVTVTRGTERKMYEMTESGRQEITDPGRQEIKVSEQGCA